MKIAFGEITTGKTRYEVRDRDCCFIPEISVGKPLEADFSLQRRDDQTITLAGQICVGMTCICDRCGAYFDHDLKTDYYYIFKQGDDDSLLMQEVECNEEDCHTVYLKEPIIDVLEVLREQVLLAVPERKVCDEGCRGMCWQCGVDLNHETCHCLAENSDSPFAVLKQLKKH